LHQYQRKIKTVDVEGEPVQYIEVTLEDLDKANTLANEVQGQSLDELAKPSRTLLSAIFTAWSRRSPINAKPALMRSFLPAA
jgi:hypothetical protein